MYWDHKEMDLVSNHTRIDMPVYMHVHFKFWRGEA